MLHRLNEYVVYMQLIATMSILLHRKVLRLTKIFSDMTFIYIVYRIVDCAQLLKSTRISTIDAFIPHPTFTALVGNPGLHHGPLALSSVTS